MVDHKITKAADFFEKYGLDGWGSSNQIDKDTNTEGVQSDANINLEELAKDYYSLKPAERYAVFARLSKGNETAVQNSIFKFDNAAPRMGIFDKLITDFKNDKYKGGDGTWRGRVVIAEGIFLAGQFLEFYERDQIESQSPTTHLEQVRNYFFSKASELYEISGKKYWDTDGDFNPYAAPVERQYYFDDKDANPLNEFAYRDSDGDLVTDGLDPFSKNSKNWNHIPKNGEVKGWDYDVAHIGGNKYEVRLNIYLKPADSATNKVSVEQAISTEKKAELALEVEKFYGEHVEQRGKDIRLRINFVDKPEDAHVTVTVTDEEKYRAKGTSWPLSIFKQPSVVLHEVMHLLGLPDNYNEALVDGGTRDRTFAPGFEKIDPSNIMNGPPPKPVVRASQMRLIVAKVNEKSDDDKYEPMPTSKLEDVHYSINSLFFWAFVAIEKIGPLSGNILEIQDARQFLLDELQKAPNDPSIMMDLARTYWLTGDKAEAEEYFNKALGLPLSVSDRRDLANDLWTIGKKEDAVAALKEGPDLMQDADKLVIMGRLSTYLLILGKPDEAYEYAQKILKIEPDSSLGHINLIEALYDMGKMEDMDAACKKTLDSISAGSEWYFQKALAEVFIHRGDVARAEKIFFKDGQNDHGSWGYKEFADILFGGQRFEEARCYYEKALADPEGSAFGLSEEKYLKTLEALGDFDSAISFHQKRLASDPYNLSRHEELAGCYIRAGKFNEAARQLIEMTRVADNLDNNRRLDGYSMEKSVQESVAGLSLGENSPNRDKIIGELKKICVELGADDKSYEKYCKLLLDEIEKTSP